MGQRKSIIREIQDTLTEKTAYNESKHEAKLDGTYTEKIYSYNTYKNYLREGCHFANWVREEYGCKNLNQAREHVPEYLQNRIDSGKSAWTVKLDAAALAKIYNCSNSDFGVSLPIRHRADVFRSRENASQGHFNIEKNKDLVDFCKATGLRKHELEKLAPEKVFQIENKTFLFVVQGKGGKERLVECLSDRPFEIAQKALHDGKEKVFDKIHAHADIHCFRSDYANNLYKKYARDLSNISRKEIYCCRCDQSGQHYDKAAMKIVSENLGHNRIDVIAQSYLK